MANRIENVRAKLEQMSVPLTAKFNEVDPLASMTKDDNEQLKEVGSSRIMIQKGKIHSPDGETVIETDLEFIRTRNAKGGVDVTCVVPSLGFETPVGG
jgi:hypothetical protein